MPSLRNKILVGLLVLACSSVFVLFFLQGGDTIAQENVNWGGDQYVCADPIPIGDMYEGTLYLLDDIYKKYADLIDELDFTINVGNSIQEDLLKNASVGHDQVCDFSNCKAASCYFSNCQTQAINISPTVPLEACLSSTGDVGCRQVTSICSPACKPLDCVGEACPAMDQHIEDLTSSKARLEGYYSYIDELFNKPSVELTEETRLIGEKTGDFVTRIQALRRVLAKANWWLTPWRESGPKTCVLNKTEEKKAEAGLMPSRQAVACEQALKAQQYWPRAFAYACEQECYSGINKECYDCLRSDKVKNEKSWYAKINYRIYKTCEKECAKTELDTECLNCICSDFDKNDSQYEKKCTGFLCGGISPLNQVCCNQGFTPPFAAPEGYEFSLDPGSGDGMFLISAYAPKEDYRGECVSFPVWTQSTKDQAPDGFKMWEKGRGVNFGIVAVDTTVIPYGSWVTITTPVYDSKKGKCPEQANMPSGYKNECPDYGGEQLTKYERTLKPDGEDDKALPIDIISQRFCACDTGSKTYVSGGNSNRIDIWLPEKGLADEWGLKWAQVSWEYDPTNVCCFYKRFIGYPLSFETRNCTKGYNNDSSKWWK